MTTNIALGILAIHFIADYICQNAIWAVNKSHSISALLQHTITYSLIWFTVGIFISLYTSIYGDIHVARLVFMMSLHFAAITFIFHTLTDFVTSKITSRMFAQKRYGVGFPNLGVFTVMGIDQYLHAFQLLKTFDLVTNL